MPLNMICPWTDSTSSSSVRAPRAGGRPLRRLAKASVAIIDRALFGGSCPFWACMPSKALLHAAAVHQGRWRLSVVESVGLPRLHDQPRGHRYPRRLRPYEGPRGSRRDGRPWIGHARRPGARPSRRPRAHRRRRGAGGRIGQPGASRPPGPRRGAPVDERRGHLNASFPLPGDPRRGTDRRRAGPGLRPLRRAGRAHPPERVHDKEHRRSSELLGESLAADGVTLKLGSRATRVRAGEGTAART